MCQFSVKTYMFDFFGPNLPKNKIRIWNSENQCWNKNQHLWDTMCTNFQTKWTTLSFWVQICPKWILGQKFQKSKSGFGISILEILGAPIFRQNEQLWIFGPKFAQKWILGSIFNKSKSGFGISILEILWAPIFRQSRQLWIFGPKFSQKWILGSEFQKSKAGFGIRINMIFHKDQTNLQKQIKLKLDVENDSCFCKNCQGKILIDQNRSDIIKEILRCSFLVKF